MQCQLEEKARHLQSDIPSLSRAIVAMIFDLKWPDKCALR